MTPDEVIEKLKRIGVEISRPTLTRYEKQKLIPEPKRGALGRGGGRWTDYPVETVSQAYAAWSLMHGNYGDDALGQLFGNKLPVLGPEVISFIRSYSILRSAGGLDDLINKHMKKANAHMLIALVNVWVDECEKAEQKISE